MRLTYDQILIPFTPNFTRHNFFPPLLFRLYCFGLLLGGIYSVPPIRTKRNPLLAGLTIATVRGFLLNFGVYYAVKDAVGASFSWSPKVSFVARFMTIFATVIAVTKDLPDIEGDKVRELLCIFVGAWFRSNPIRQRCIPSLRTFRERNLLKLAFPHAVEYLYWRFYSQAFQIETFATKVGVKRIAQGASLCLLANYVHAIATGLLAPTGTFKLLPMVGGHFILGLMLIQRFKKLDPDSMPSIKTYYKNIWDLFYLEYGLYTLI